jgi:hypothetical protein
MYKNTPSFHINDVVTLHDDVPLMNPELYKRARIVEVKVNMINQWTYGDIYHYVIIPVDKPFVKFKAIIAESDILGLVNEQV